MLLSEISLHNRSSIDPIAYSLFCFVRRTICVSFGKEKVFGPLVGDLRDLEEAVELGSGQIIQGAVLAIAGDNLGSHMIGGFTENFSKSKHFCC